MFGPCFVLWLFVPFLAEEERAGYFTLIVLWLSVFCISYYLFLTVPWDGLHFLIVGFPGLTHLLFAYNLFLISHIRCCRYSKEPSQ